MHPHRHHPITQVPIASKCLRHPRRTPSTFKRVGKHHLDDGVDTTLGTQAGLRWELYRTCGGGRGEQSLWDLPHT